MHSCFLEPRVMSYSLCIPTLQKAAQEGVIGTLKPFK